MASSPVLVLLVYGGYAHYSKVSTYWRDSLLLTQLCRCIIINIHVSHPSVTKHALIHLPEEGKTVICVKIHIVFGLLMLPMLITIMHVHVHTTFVATMIK